MIDYEAALNVKLERNDAGANDVRCYLGTLLLTVLEEEESFSGKRPFGNSGWLYDLEEPLKAAGFDPSKPNFWPGLVGELCSVKFDHD